MKLTKHLDFIRSLPCVICGDNTATEACHIRYSDAAHNKVNPGIGRKPSDEHTIPLCSKHHREQHRTSEIGFWRSYNLDPVSISNSLFSCSGDHEKGCKIIADIAPSNLTLESKVLFI